MPAHIIGHIPNSWGHIKPLLVLFAHLAERRSRDALVLTLLSSGPMMTKIQRELELMSGAVAKRLNVIDVGTYPPIQPMVGFGPVFEALWKKEPVTCKTTGRELVGLPQPSVVILDLYCGYALPMVKQISNGTCPVVAWSPCPMSNVLRLAGPDSMGGYGDMQSKIANIMGERNKSFNEVADEIYMKVRGDVVETPGLPLIYDYEGHPQELNFSFSPAIIFQGSHKLLMDSDGLLTVSVSAYEPGCINAGREWLKSLGKDLWVVGPLDSVPSADTQTIPEAEAPQHTAEDAKIISFLDQMKAEHGEHSVIVIAFGTMFYPKDTAKLHAFIDELISSGTPFLWGHASPMAIVPADLETKLQATKNAFHTNWIPQRAALSHAATGWFLSHGGWNSVQDALGLKVPMIFWPFASDQPINASLLSITHEAAFELLSIRSGAGAQLPYRCKDDKGSEAVDFTVDGVRRETRQLLARLKSEEGRRVRANAEKLGNALYGSWEKGGEANSQVEAFLGKFVDAV